MLHHHDYQYDNTDSDESENHDDVTAVIDNHYVVKGNQSSHLYALPLDLACVARDRPSLEFIHLLTNGRPPLHFLCKYSYTPWIPTRMNAIKYVASILPPDDGMRFYHSVVPFHWVCRSRAPRSVLEWWCEQYPAIASVRTTHTHELPLHCYLSSTATEKSEKAASVEQRRQCNDACYLSAVQLLVEQHPDALNSMNRMGCLPFHAAALHGASLDVLYYLVCQNPGALLTGSPWLSSSEKPLDNTTG